MTLQEGASQRGYVHLSFMTCMCWSEGKIKLSFQINSGVRSVYYAIVIRFGSSISWSHTGPIRNSGEIQAGPYTVV